MHGLPVVQVQGLQAENQMGIHTKSSQMKNKFNPISENTETARLRESIDYLLPELVRSRDRINAAILEIERYRSAINEHPDNDIARLVMRVTLEYFGVSRYALEGKSRDTTIRMARQVFMALTKTITGFSNATVGGFVGKDHATVLHAKKVVANTKDPIYEHYLAIKTNVNEIIINASGEKTKSKLPKSIPLK